MSLLTKSNQIFAPFHPPDAHQPEDWSSEDDGEWEPPTIKNPACKAAGCGEWKRPMVKNPAYKGPWSPKEIANPAYKGKWEQKTMANPDYYVVSFCEDTCTIATL